jgi:hypothetical protein
VGRDDRNPSRPTLGPDLDQTCPPITNATPSVARQEDAMPTQSNRRQPSGAAAARHATEPRANLDPGAYIGRKPERATETIPGGLGPKDRRVSAVATQPGDPSTATPQPEGHREGEPAGDDAVREAGDKQ